ncbi:MAG: adenylosuccinate synthetase [Candidatus Marsarchaeota archaeon]|nr:adenylosuccinate synthetase [Candidatus Marsarchaeota archaeon]MCL5413230.1 adenylosuccinate synthetase [Candidatus Marsarchaeota archaeon]
MIDILVGGFFGDEGKGKVASYIAVNDKPDMALRTGGTNAGHTTIYNGKTYKLRTMSSAFLSDRTRIAIPPGALIKTEVLFKEMEETNTKGRVIIDGHAAVITEAESNEEKSNVLLDKEVGSTKEGVGSAESKRVLRCLKLAKDYPELSEFIRDVPDEVIKCVEKGGKVFVEGSQGHLLSLYHGQYPYVTSRNTTASGALSDVGVGPKYVDNITVIFKAFVTRVGGGPMKGELTPEQVQEKGMVEYGTVTKRLRRAAPFDTDIALEAVRVSSANQAAITKVDALFKGAERVRSYSELPGEAKDWIRDIEDKIKIPVTLIGTGPDALDMIDRRPELLGK